MKNQSRIVVGMVSFDKIMEIIHEQNKAKAQEQPEQPEKSEEENVLDEILETIEKRGSNGLFEAITGFAEYLRGKEEKKPRELSREEIIEKAFDNLSRIQDAYFRNHFTNRLITHVAYGCECEAGERMLMRFANWKDQDDQVSKSFEDPFIIDLDDEGNGKTVRMITDSNGNHRFILEVRRNYLCTGRIQSEVFQWLSGTGRVKFESGFNKDALSKRFQSPEELFDYWKR